MSRHPSPPDGEGAQRIPLGGAISLEWKLPLLMTAFIAAGLALMLALTYGTLASRAELIVRDRLTHANAEVARGAEAAMRQRAEALSAAAADEAVRRALLASREGRADEAALADARRVLAAVPIPADSLLPVELWNADGSLVTYAGPALPEAIRQAPGAAWLSASPGAEVRFTPLAPAGERVRFWIVAPVVSGGRALGWVAWPRNVGGPARNVESLRAMLREEVTIWSRNADGSVLAGARGEPLPPPLRRDSAERGVSYERADAGEVVAAETPIAGTPWVMGMEVPRSAIISRPRSTLRQLALPAALVMLIGAALSWLASRRITRPLKTLTAASEAVASGRYERPVAGRGRDEIARLAASFDAMARQVEAARGELERRVAEAQETAGALAATNEQLRATTAEAERSRTDAERARAEAEHANRAKSDFLAVMSHELRTPLNAILGYTQLLEMGVHGPVTAAQREALVRIGASQAHLLTLINDVLSYARIDAGQVRYAIADFALHETLGEVEALVEPQVRASRLAFHYRPCDLELCVRADPDKVRQVLLNLLGNAVKYTPEGGVVTVECEADPRRVRIHVRDTGTGIRPERLPFIFDPFVQGERALNRPDEGVGLGLAISRELAHGMGGELMVASEPGVGSTFTLVLDRADVPVALPMVPVIRTPVGAAEA